MYSLKYSQSLICTALILFFSFQVQAITVVIDEELRDGAFPTGWTSELGSTPPPIARTAANGYFLISANDTWVQTTDYDFSAFNTAILKFDVATFGSGANNPLQVEYSLNGGLTWETNTFTTAIPTSGTTYISSGLFIFETNNSSQVRLRFTRPAETGRGVRFRDLVMEGSNITQPTPFDLSLGNFSFTEWNANEPAGTFPANMAFHGHSTTDPDIEVPMLSDWYCVYDKDFRSRFEGLGSGGIRLVNTGNTLQVSNCNDTQEGLNVGAVVASINTEGRTDVTLNWSARLHLQTTGDRFTNLSLQYRIKDNGNWPATWIDVSGQVFESEGKSAGNTEDFEITLCELADAGDVQLRWVYHISPNAGTSGSRSNIDLQEIQVTSLPIVTPHVLANGAFIFDNWSENEPAGTYPDNMVFLQHSVEEPDENTRFEFEYTCAYNLENRGRINGLGNEGFSFINTGNPQNDASCMIGGYLGAADVAINTSGMSNLLVDWTGIQKTTGGRTYRIQVQYRVGSCGSFTNIANQHWTSDNTGDSNNEEQNFSFSLPADAENEEVVYLRWIYYQVFGSGDRPRMAISEINIYPETLYTTNSGDQSYGGENNTQTWSTDPNGTGNTFSPLFPRTQYVIQNGHTVTIRNSGNGNQESLSFGEIIIENGGKFQANQSATSPVYINLHGNIQNDGEIGDTNGSNTISLNVEPGEHTFSGSGTYNLYRLRKSNVYSNNNDLDLTFDADVYLWWNNSASIYNNRSGSSLFNITLKEGRTLTVEGDVSIDGVSGGTNTDRGGSYTIENNAVLDLKGTFFLSNRNDENPTALNILSGGLVIASDIQFTDDGTNISDATLNIESGGKLAFTGAQPFTDNPDASNVFALSPEGTIEFSANQNQLIDITSGVLEFPGLTLSGSGQKTFEGDELVINGNLELGGTAQLVKIGASDEIVFKGTSLFNDGNEEIIGVFILEGDDQQLVTGYSVFDDLIINNTSGVSLPDQAGVFADTEVRRGLTFNAGAELTAANNLVLRSTATQTAYLIDNSGVSPNPVTGNIKIERNVSGPNGYRQISSPVENIQIQQIDGFTPSGSNGVKYYIVDYDDEDANSQFNKWLGMKANVFTFVEDAFESVNGEDYRFYEGYISGAMDIGRGYSFYKTSSNTVNNTYRFSGTPNTGNINIPLTYTAIDAEQLNNGWNLIGNPYPSPIQWSSVSSSGLPTGLNNAVYVFDNTQNSNAFRGEYKTFINGFATNGFDGNIAQGQAFWVKTEPNYTGTGLSLNNSHRLGSATTTFYKEAEDLRSVIRMEARLGDFGDEMVVYFEEGATTAYDENKDAYKRFHPGANLQSFYSLDATNRYSIQGLPLITEDIYVPLGIFVQKEGSYHFNLLELEHIPATSMIYFEDAQTGHVQNLRNEESYSVYLEKGMHEERFYIRISAPIEWLSHHSSCENELGKLTVVNESSIAWDIEVTEHNLQDSKIEVFTSFIGELDITLSPGMYDVHFSYDGYEAVKTIEIEDRKRVYPAFEVYADVVMVGEHVVIENMTDGADEYLWDFNDGTQVSNDFAPVHSYNKPGMYEILLKASNEECSAMSSKVVQVKMSMPTSVEEVSAEGIKVYSAHQHIHVLFTDENVASQKIQLVNALGQEIGVFDNTNSMHLSVKLNTSNIPSQIVFVVLRGKENVKSIPLYINN